MVVDFTDANVLAELECLHIDHTYDINLICRAWLDLLPQRPVSWHENINVEVLCHVPGADLRFEGVSIRVSYKIYRTKTVLFHL